MLTRLRAGGSSVLRRILRRAAASPSRAGAADPARCFLAGEPARRPPHRPTRVGELAVAAVAGPRLREGLAEACHLVTFRPDNWRYVLEAQPPDLLLVESSWQGNRGSWRYRVGEIDGLRDPELEELVGWCRTRGVPTAFWATRPAPELGPFLRAARAFDLVFCADPAAAGPLPGARPLALAVPAGPPQEATGDRPVAVTYAGRPTPAWSPSRRALFADLLEAAAEHGLRRLDANGGRAALRAALGRTRVVLVVPRAGGSTLVPGLVLDAVHAGAAVVGPDLAGARELLGAAVVDVTSGRDARTALRELLEDEAAREAATAAARAVVRDGQTYAHRLQALATAAGKRVAL